jgi:hypothetical protein
MNPALESPIFKSVSPWLEKLPAARFPTCAELNALAPQLRFVQADGPLEEPYETYVHRTRQVPTRPDNWHDVFNALAWLAFPRTKAVLNRRHCEELGRAVDPGRRGTARDVLTVFDEGGVIVASTDPSLLELLRGFEWKTLFWERRGEVEQHMRFFVFGHAILEKALEPYKGVTAKAMLLQVPEAFPQRPFLEQIAEADRKAAEWLLQPGALSSTRNLSPLPVLGVPGWADNARADFYDDERVFRPGYATVTEKRAP